MQPGACILLGVLLALTGCAADPTASAAPNASASTAPSTSLPGPQPLPDTRTDVVRVQLAAIGVDAAPLEPLGLLPDGSLAAPADFGQAGWFAGGTVPGQRGPAVIAGHVDSVAGPAVFFRLRELKPGNLVVVELADGSELTFSVYRTEQVPKDAFPTAEVYGPTPDAELRLITCGGEFDRSERSYRDNTVVFARLVG